MYIPQICRSNSARMLDTHFSVYVNIKNNLEMNLDFHQYSEDFDPLHYPAIQSINEIDSTAVGSTASTNTWLTGLHYNDEKMHFSTIEKYQGIDGSKVWR